MGAARTGDAYFAVAAGPSSDLWAHFFARGSHVNVVVAWPVNKLQIHVFDRP